MKVAALILLSGAAAGLQAQRRVDPTFLRRFVPELSAKPADVTTVTCHYKPIFGSGDADTKILGGVARFGEITIDAGGSSAP
ncbi:MAG: cupin domain-containing protein, partial [Acidobacteria bacterium]|nr:cupin domain-containing protein [Acidobacteriota bacterium]